MRNTTGPPLIVVTHNFTRLYYQVTTLYLQDNPEVFRGLRGCDRWINDGQRFGIVIESSWGVELLAPFFSEAAMRRAHTEFNRIVRRTAVTEFIENTSGVDVTLNLDADSTLFTLDLTTMLIQDRPKSVKGSRESRSIVFEESIQPNDEPVMDEEVADAPTGTLVQCGEFLSVATLPLTTTTTHAVPTTRHYSSTGSNTGRSTFIDASIDRPAQSAGVATSRMWLPDAPTPEIEAGRPAVEQRSPIDWEVTYRQMREEERRVDAAARSELNTRTEQSALAVNEALLRPTSPIMSRRELEDLLLREGYRVSAVEAARRPPNQIDPTTTPATTPTEDPDLPEEED